MQLAYWRGTMPQSWRGRKVSRERAMPPFFAALIAAVLTVCFFALFHAKVKKAWLRNILIVVATLGSLALGGILSGSNERSELTGQIYFVLIVIAYLVWKFLLRKRFIKPDSPA